jgi:hypothetical protein
MADALSRHLSEQEYLTLSDQKAEDWRTITQVNPALFGVAGVLFAAGVSEEVAWATVMSPLPLLLGVFHMVRNAKLQLPMITYLATHTPFGSASWEHDIAIVRPRFWKRKAATGLSNRVRRLGRMGPRVADELSRLSRPSAWNTWLAVTLLVGVAADLFPVLAGHNQGWIAFGAGIGALIAGSVLVGSQAKTIEDDRDLWTELWEQYLSQGREGHSD